MRKLVISAILIIVGVLLAFPALAAENVRNVNVSIFPSLAGQASQYTLGFNVSSSGALQGGRDEIAIVFPEGSRFPDKLQEEEVLVNGYPVDVRTVYIEERTLTFVVPSNVNITNNGYVGIIITNAADIRTPNKSGSFPIAIKTTFDNINYSNKFSLTGSSLSNLQVAVSPASVNDYAEYFIGFRTSHNGQLLGGQDWIYLEFPDDVDLPRTIAGEYVQINDKKLSDNGVEVDSAANRIALQIPGDLNISARQGVEVVISEEARIRNPRSVGEYDLNVYSSKDTLGNEDEFSIGMTITRPMVVVSPNQAGVIGQYTVGFTTSSRGALAAAEDYIYIKFPSTTTLPSANTVSYVTVNGLNASEVSVGRSENRLAIRIPRELNIAGDSYVNVVIKGEAQVHNPGTAGDYRLEISTTSDQSYTKSNDYTILGEAISSPVVYLSSYKTGDYPNLEMGFRLSSAGELIGAEDTITVEFPEEFELPSSINAEDITVNNQVVPEASINNQILKLTLPTELNLESRDSVKIVISSISRIRNPQEKGSYYITFLTSKDPRPVNSRTITIGDNTSETTQKPMIELTNYQAGHSARYLIALFNDLSVLEGGDTIEVNFPADTVIPRSISAQLVKLNGFPVEGIEVNNNKVTVTIPDDFNIGYQDKIILAIDESVGIKNPGTSGTYNLSINLDGVKSQESMAYEITGSQKTSRKVVFRVGSTLAESNSQLINLQAAPTIIQSYTVVPLRNLGDALGATTSFDAASRVINVQYNGKTIVFVVGSKMAKVGDDWVPIDIAPTIINGRTMIPVRFVSQSFGAVVQWNDATSEITITQ